MEIEGYHSNTQRRAKEELVLYPTSLEEQAADILQHNNLNPKDFNGNKKKWLSSRTLERSPSFSVFSFCFHLAFPLKPTSIPPGLLPLSLVIFLPFPFVLFFPPSVFRNPSQVTLFFPPRFLCFSLLSFSPGSLSFSLPQATHISLTFQSCPAALHTAHPRVDKKINKK